MHDYSFKAYGRSTLVAAVMTAFITTFMSSALNLSIPTLEVYFDANATTISWAVTGYTMSIASTSVIFGKLADMTDRYKWMVGGISLFLLTTILTPFTRTIYQFIAMRMIEALGAAMIHATNNAILLSNYPDFMRGKAMGYSTASAYIGLTAGPVLGGQLQSAFGWKSIFMASGIFTVAALTAAIVSWRMKLNNKKAGSVSGTGLGSSESLKQDFDAAGALLYIIAVPMSLFGLSQMSVNSKSVFFLIGGIALIIAFGFCEKRPGVRSPIIDVRMFSASRVFSLSILATALNYAATYAISYCMSIYLQLVKGIDPAVAGMIMIIMPAVQAAFSPLMGSLSDRVSPSKLASVGMSITTVTLLVLSTIKTDTPLAVIMVILAVTGFGFAVFSSPNMNAIMEQVNKQDYGVANSMVATARTYGQTAGMSMLNVVIGIILGSAALQSSSPESIVRVIHISFLMFTCVSIIGVFCSLAKTKK